MRNGQQRNTIVRYRAILSRYINAVHLIQTRTIEFGVCSYLLHLGKGVSVVVDKIIENVT